MTKSIISAIAAVTLWAGASVATAQYPTVPQDIAEASAKAKSEANKSSNEAFRQAMPIIEQWEAKGRPHRPWANDPMDLVRAPIPAFPGAWGGGMYTYGGRGGKVIVVTSLEDSGPGTFREACETGGPRIIVFNVAGIIHLKSRIRIRAPYVTIAGQTAPGDGICIAGQTVGIDTHDVVIRHMRFRRGATNVGDRDDALGGNPVGNIMIDHVSASWGLDENMSMYRHMFSLPDGSPYLQDPVVFGKYRAAYTPKDPNVDLKLPTVNITIQNSISSEALDTYNHAFGSTIGGRNSTFHHNLWACNTGRNPSVGMDGDFGFVNNVLFNWRHRTVDGGDYLSLYNIINNYYKPGPATPADKPIAYRILKAESRRSKTITNDFGRAFVSGNIVEGNDKVTANNWDGGVQLEDSADPSFTLPRIQAERPFSIAPLPIQSAQEAYNTVLATAGATLPVRDPVDQRVIEMVKTGKVTYKEGIITDIDQVGGYPQYKGDPIQDSDNDGMPDAWETAKGLNPQDPSDANGDLNGDGYTNIEKYINSIDTDKKVDWADLRNNVDTLKAAPYVHLQQK